MGKFKDLTGQRFGRLTVIERAEDRISPSGKRVVRWKCKCDCGNDYLTSGDYLKYNPLPCCTECANKKKSQKLTIDLSGHKFGRLTAIKKIDDYYRDGKSKTMWLCRCDCGNENVIVSRCDLQNGKTKSCGCYRRETIRNTGKQNKKTNIYDLTGEYGIGYTSNGEKFYFDIEDYDKIKNYSWFINSHGYVRATDSITHKSIDLHRLIMGTQDDEFATGIRVDHIKTENRTDNRKCNLRIVQQFQNNQNHKLRITNTSGVTGVCYNISKNKWEARIGLKNHKYHLGTFDKFEDATAARKEAEEKYFGEYSYDNSQKIAALNERID